MAYTISNQPLAEEDFYFIQEQLDTYATGGSIVSVSEMDGFFTAVLSCAEVIAFDSWYPAFWGGVDLLPKWKSDTQFQRFFDMLVQHMNQIALMLAEYQDDYSPIFNLGDDDVSLEVEHWCYGYQRGVALDPAWAELPEHEQMLHALIALNTLGLSDDQADPEDDNPLADQDPAQMVRFAAIGLYNYWIEQRPEEEARHEPLRIEAKVGRNDPCPCGSGKKFKQCCMS